MCTSKIREWPKRGRQGPVRVGHIPGAGAEAELGSGCCRVKRLSEDGKREEKWFYVFE